MLELGQPTHPYDLALLGGSRPEVRRARAGRDGRDARRRDPHGGRARAEPRRHRRGLPHLRRARTCRWASAGIMGGASSEIADGDDRGAARGGLLHAHGHRPHLQAPGPAHRGVGALRAGVRPVGDRAARCGGSARSSPRASPGSSWPTACSTSAATVPEPFVVSVPVARVGRQIGVALGRDEIARLIEPIGFTVLDLAADASTSMGPAAGAEATGDDGAGRVTVVVPTNRPDVRPEPYGVDDVIEEIARMFGYGNIPRHVPTWPQPGGLTSLQRSRRTLKDVLCGLGASEAWTDTFVSADGARRHRPPGPGGPGCQPARRGEAVAAAVADAGAARGAGLQRRAAPARGPALRGRRRVLAPRRRRAAHRRARRRGWRRGGRVAGEREVLSAVFARDADDARDAVASWQVIAESLHLAEVRLVGPGDGVPPLPGLHPTRLGAARGARSAAPAHSRSVRSGRSTLRWPPRSG